MFYKLIIAMFTVSMAVGYYKNDVLQDKMYLDMKVRSKAQFDSIVKAELSYVFDNCQNASYVANDIDYNVLCSEDNNLTTYDLQASNSRFSKRYSGAYNVGAV